MQQNVYKSSPTGERSMEIRCPQPVHTFTYDLQGYGRQGAAYHGLGDLKAAEAAYRKGLEVEPGYFLVNFFLEITRRKCIFVLFDLHNLFGRLDYADKWAGGSSASIAR